MTPESLGLAYEATLSTEQRRRTGAFYTPPPLAASLAEATLGPLLDSGADPSSITVCDPAVGTGALLLAAARLLMTRGARHVERQLCGVDTDGRAVGVAGQALRLLCGAAPALTVADALDRPPPLGTFDVVLTNPPFLNQLRTATVRADRTDRWGDAGKGYADTANLFLLLSVDLVRAGGRVGILLPEPILAARDAAPTRRRVGTQTSLISLVRPGLGAFDAGVRVCVMTVVKETPSDTAWAQGQWAPAASENVPAVDLRSTHRVGDLATVTADFRDQYYGTAAVAVDSDQHTPIVTCGLIDPLRIQWGTRPARIARRVLMHPSADLTRASPAIRRWAAARLVPKVMVATQTRILEAAADDDGQWLPMVPVISVVPAAASDLWHLVAALNSPPLSAYAHRMHTGAALSADAIKLSARQVAALPLPPPSAAWDEAAALARHPKANWYDSMTEMGALMCDAYDVPRDPVFGWWVERLDRLARRA